MGTKCFTAAGVFSVELLAYQIGQYSSIYLHDIILGCVYDIISHLICIFYTFFKLKYLQS